TSRMKTSFERTHKRISALSAVCFLPFLSLATYIVLALNAQAPRREFALKAESERFWDLLDHNASLGRVATGFGFTEGPVWDEHGFLYVSDEEQNKIFKVREDGSKQEVISLGDPDGNTYDDKHRLIDCASVLRAIIAITPNGKYTVLADQFEGKKFN